MKSILTFEKNNRLKRWLHNYKNKLLMIMLLFPNIFCYSPELSDSSNTAIDFLMGFGKYADVSYSCEGNITDINKYSFNDYGGSISHSLDWFKFGIKGGGFSISGNSKNSYNEFYWNESASLDSYTSEYLNPFIALNHKYFELSVGLLLLTEYPSLISNSWFEYGNKRKTAPTFQMRIGNQRAFHFSSHFLSNVPLLSGGGLIDMGFGFGSKNSRTLTWVGLSAGPFQKIGLGLKQNVELTKNIDLIMKSRVGQNESNFEGSFSAGVGYNF